MKVRLSFKAMLQIDGRQYKGVKMFWINQSTNFVTLLQKKVHRQMSCVQVPVL